MKPIALAVAGTLLALAIAAPSAATLNTCAAAKRACVAKRTAAILGCHAKAEKPPGMDAAKVTACLQKARDKFDGGVTPEKGCFAKLEAKYGAECLTSSDTAALAATGDAYIDDVICQLDPGAGTCSCSDGIQNGEETAIDCGGTKCGPCELGDQCTEPADCPATTTCGGGNTCVCAAGQADCNASAADACEITPATDVNNCGACNNVCNLDNANEACVASQCTVASCTSGFRNCNAVAGDGCEVDANSDPSNCGNCGLVCSSNHGTPSCSSGTCQIACQSGWGNCDANVVNGCETSLNSNAHCGACNNACFGGTTCIAGTCQ